nr:hypothetical protein [Rhodopirellula sp. SM50]
MPPPREYVVVEQVDAEYQHSATTLPALQTDVASPSSLSPIAAPRDERLVENEYQVRRMIDEYFSGVSNGEHSIATLRDVLNSTLRRDCDESDELSENDVLVVNRKRKILFSDSVDLGNLPKRRPPVVLLGPDEFDE